MTKAKQDPAAIIRDLRRQLAESEKERAAAVELAEKQRKKIVILTKHKEHKMALKDTHLYSEIAPGGLKGYARPHEGADTKIITIVEINNGDKLTIISEDAPYVIKWLVQEMNMVDAVLLWDWLQHDHLGIERPERIEPEQGEGPF